MFKNMSFKFKLLIPLVCVALVLVGVAVIGISGNSQVRKSVDVISHRYLPGIDSLLQADRDLFQALLAERSFIFLDVKSDEYQQQVKDHDENIKQARARVEKFAELIQSPRIDALVTRFRGLFDTWEEVTRRIEKERTQGGRIGRSTAIELTFGEGAQKFSDMRDIIDQLTEIS